MKELYLSGKELDGLKEALENTRGVEALTYGSAMGEGFDFSVNCLRVEYNPKKIDITELLKIYFAAVDPYSPPETPSMSTAVLFKSGEDAMQIEYYLRFLQMRGAEPAAALGELIVNDSITEGVETRPLLTLCGRLKSFTAL